MFLTVVLLSASVDGVEHLVFVDFVLLSVLDSVGSSASVAPLVFSVALASVFVDPFRAFFAFDVTAPMEFAFAFVSSEDATGVVASSAAHDVATVGAHGSRVASTSRGTQAARRRIGVAIIRRRLEVHQIGFGGLFQGFVDGDELVAALVHRDLSRGIVFLLQILADSFELLHGDPTSTDGASSGDSVAFALQADETLDGFAAGAVVVEVHQVARVFASLATAFSRVDEEFGEFGAVPDVVGAAAPLEHALLIAAGASSTVVAFAVLQLAFTAAASDAVDDGGGGDGVDERSFAGTACHKGREKKDDG